jgi:hypothetical protein
MTDNEIIKALESEVKSAEYVDSYYCDGVDLTLIKNTLDLINRQHAEIERLNIENEILSKNADNAFQDGLNEAQDLYAEQVKAEIKSEAIKEFAERLKQKSEYYENGQGWEGRICYEDDIDKLLKEMVGDTE